MAKLWPVSRILIDTISITYMLQPFLGLENCFKFYGKCKIFLMAIYMIYKYGNDSASLHRLIKKNCNSFMEPVNCFKHHIQEFKISLTFNSHHLVMWHLTTSSTKLRFSLLCLLLCGCILEALSISLQSKYFSWVDAM